MIRKALRDMDHDFIESAYKFLSSPHDNLPKPITAMEKLFLHTYQMALAEDKTSHQYAKLIFERVIPQRKQVEHLGELDAQMGVNINVITEKVANEQREPIEHEPIGRQEHDGGELYGGCAQEQPRTLVYSSKDARKEER